MKPMTSTWGARKPYMERIAGGCEKGTPQKFAKESEEQQDDFKEEIKAVP